MPTPSMLKPNHKNPMVKAIAPLTRMNALNNGNLM